jgi:predicted metalloprotease with PDZ domain
MTGPKHLWAGDWEDESAAARDQHAEAVARPRAAQPPPEPPKPPKPPKPPEPKPDPSKRSRRRAWIAAAALVVVVAAAAATTLGGSSKPTTTTTAAAAPPASPPSSAQTTPATATTPSPAADPVRWLGMEIVTVSPGAAVVETVALGSAADRAGIEPADVILSIGGRSVSGSKGIARAIHGLHAGERVKLQISRGSAPYEAVVTLGAPPTAYP